MSNIYQKMFKAQKNGRIYVDYPCSTRGPSVDVNIHGTVHAAWTLIDDFEKHLDKCRQCKAIIENEKRVKKTIEALKRMQPAVQNLTTAFYNLKHTANEIAKGTQPAIEIDCL